MTPLHPFEDWELSAYEAGDLEPHPAGRVRAHLAECETCAGRVAEFALMRGGLASLGELAPAPDAWDRIAATLPPRLHAVPGGHPFEDWQLSASLDGDLDARETAQLEAHLVQCAPCRARRDDLQSLMAGLASLPSLEPSPFLWTRVQAGLWQRPERRVSRLEAMRLWLPSGIAAAAALMIGLFGAPQLGIDPGFQLVNRTPDAPASAASTIAPARTDVLASSGTSSFSGSREAVGPATPAPRLGPARPASRASYASAPAGDASYVSDDGGPGADADPALTASIRARLDELDAAINETQKNLAMNPGNERVQAAAWSAYMAKVEYLRSLMAHPAPSKQDRSSSMPAAAMAVSPA